MARRVYVVTVTPKMKIYSGSWSNGQYKEEIEAESAAEAMKISRRMYNDNMDDVAATFKARLWKEEIDG